ncbi:hypothetical protein Thiowin_01345 [Thiorhodovibrio winogradskyi]|uniref:Uncharacterized protein n=1 Tax=Thiorhodovibrio winogradskyi TaxID=77007 RepID=A0ABZ0S8C4_9GAMM|nr:hypothetical protein [Thiorhodovibrio winogradskyi]
MMSDKAGTQRKASAAEVGEEAASSKEERDARLDVTKWLEELSLRWANRLDGIADRVRAEAADAETRVLDSRQLGSLIASQFDVQLIEDLGRDYLEWRGMDGVVIEGQCLSMLEIAIKQTVSLRTARASPVSVPSTRPYRWAAASIAGGVLGIWLSGGGSGVGTGLLALVGATGAVAAVDYFARQPEVRAFSRWQGDGGVAQADSGRSAVARSSFLGRPLVWLRTRTRQGTLRLVARIVDFVLEPEHAPDAFSDSQVREDVARVLRFAAIIVFSCLEASGDPGSDRER